MLLQRLGAGALVIGLGIFGFSMHTTGIENETVELTAPFSRGNTPAIGYQVTVETAVDYLNNNSNYVVVVEGHTGTRGPATTNQKLSEVRAERVAEDLLDSGIDNARIFVYASGEDKPLAQLDDEHDNVFQSRLNRVNLYIVHKAVNQEDVL